MQTKWRKLLTREGVDITTIADCVTKVMHRQFSDFIQRKEEFVFTYFKDKIYTQYLSFDPQKFGYYLFKKYYNTPIKVKNLVNRGEKLLQSIQKRSTYWRQNLTLHNKKELYIQALVDFERQAEKVSHLYSIGGWFAIEAWQNRFAEKFNIMIQRNNLEKKAEKIFASVYKPWRKTAIQKIQQRLKQGIEIKKLVSEYQYLRSWSIIWFEPIDESWIKRIGKSPKKEKKHYTLTQLNKLLKPSGAEKRHLEIAPYLVFFKDWRDELRRRFVYQWNFLFQNIAQKTGLPYNDLGYLTIAEIKAMLSRNQIPREKIRRRKNKPSIVIARIPDIKMKVIDQGRSLKKYLAIIKNLEKQKITPPKLKWRRLASRENTDITLVFAGVNPFFYNLIWEFYKKKKQLFFTVCANRNFTHYIAIDPQELGSYIFKKYFDSPQKIINHYEQGKILLQEIKRKTRKWQKILKVNSGLKSYLATCQDFCGQLEKVNSVYNITSWFAVEVWQDMFQKMLNKMIARNNLKNQKWQITASAYKPWKETAIPRLRDEIRQGADPKDLVRKFQFLRSWSIIWFNRIDQAWIKNVGRVSRKEKTTKYYSHKELVRLLNPTLKEREQLKLAPYLTFFKDWRDDLRRSQVYFWNFLFQLIAKKLKVKYDDLGYLTIDEIKDALKRNKIKQNTIAWRKKNPCVVTIDAPHLRMKLVDDKTAVNKYLTIIKNAEKQPKDQIITGTVAQRGLARGSVKIIRSFKDIKKIKRGEILVANTTHPNYLPGMQKAAAIVTNEGGMACHAAIVARELKKPCVVGTKIATQVLKDGDEVEVDADRGMVKIIF